MEMETTIHMPAKKLSRSLENGQFVHLSTQADLQKCRSDSNAPTQIQLIKLLKASLLEVLIQDIWQTALSSKLLLTH